MRFSPGAAAPWIAAAYKMLKRKSQIVVLIPDVDDWLSLSVAYCLKTSGRVTVHGLSRCQSKRLRLSNLFASFSEIVDFDLGGWLARIDQIVAERRVDLVLPVSSIAIRALSEHRRTLASADRLVQLPEPDAFDTATNKASLAGFLAAHGFPHPPAAVVTAGAPRPERLSALAFPVLVKPPLSKGGQGIRRFENRKQLDAFLTDQDKENWVVQEFVQGTDLGVNVLCQNGHIIASTVQHAIVPSSIPYRAATNIEFKDDSSAMEVVAKLVKELNWSGVANVDLRLSGQTAAPVVLEVNGRYWFSLLGSLHADVNFPLLACEIALGSTKSNLRPRVARHFAGLRYAVLSLIGGGRWRVRPSETDLGYLLRDPIFFMSMAIGKAYQEYR